MLFEDKDRLAVDIHAVEYDFMEEDQSFQNLKARIEAYLEESRNEINEYLKEEGDWDPAWDKELGLE